jgi:hypothetical protein
MAWHVIKKKKGLGITFGQAFENVNRIIDLHEEIFSAEISVTVLASLEDNPSLPKDRLVKGRGRLAMDRLIAITQVAPLGRQKVQDHDCLAIAFGLWCWPADIRSPRDLAMIVLEKCGLIVGDEDKSEWEAVGHWESIRAWEFMSVIIPLVEAHSVSLPPLNKCTSIGHNILPLMAIDVHPILGSLVPPVKMFQPVDCCGL